MIFGAILAGGTGTRMNMADMPKQFLPLGGGKPVLVHTLEKFLLSSRIDQLYVGVHPDWILYTQDLLVKYELDAKRIRVIAGGIDRSGTILNVISAIEADHGVSDEHIIVTHDAVRPFVTLRIIEENITSAIEYGACDTVVPATDTIVVSKNGTQISDIPQRSYMYQGQTPQSFNISLIKSLYEDLSPQEKSMLTDACKICFIREVPVHMVRGDVTNLKLTTLADYKVAQAMIESGTVD